MQLERFGARARLTLLGVVALVAVVTAACLPPPPPPPPPPTTTTTKPPPAICGVNALSAGAPAAAPAPPANGSAGRYAAVVERDGRSQVLTRTVRSPSEVARFRADAAAQGEVLAFAPDGEVYASAEAPTWGFGDSKFAAAWNAATPTPTNGTGVRVAVLDTGIDTLHPDLAGHFAASPGADIVTANAPTRLEPPQPALDPPPPVTTDPSTSGHGTHVAGILAATAGNDLGVSGAAPGVTLVPVRVLSANGSGTYADVAAGILWAADVTKGNAKVITLSLGGAATNDAVIAAVATVEDLGNPNYTHPVITVAAGNSGCNNTQFPASLGTTTPQVLAVSGLCKVGVSIVPPSSFDSCPSAAPWPADGAFKLATYSSLAWNGTGTPSGITAPGTALNSTLPGGGYGFKSGTSMATPFVAAAAALVIAHCGLTDSYTAGRVVDRLEASARDLGRAGPDKLYGYGLLDADAAVRAC